MLKSTMKWVLLSTLILQISSCRPTSNAAKAEAAYQQGLAQEKKQDFKSAVNSYSEAIKYNPKAFKAYFHRGLSRGSIDMGSENKILMVEDFTRAIDLKPDLLVLYDMRAIVRSGTGDQQGALADQNHIIKQKPNWATAYLMRSRVYYELGDKVRQKEDMSKFTSLSKNKTIFQAEMDEKAVLSKALDF